MYMMNEMYRTIACCIGLETEAREETEPWIESG
jgi:hypothetical protein